MKYEWLMTNNIQPTSYNLLSGHKNLSFIIHHS